jgi:hypothetical protein
MNPAVAVMLAFLLGLFAGSVFAEDLRRAFERLRGD